MASSSHLLAWSTMRASLAVILPGYITKESAIQMTSSRALKWSIMHGGTSWPMTIPSSSIISMVTSRGLGKSPLHDMAKTCSLEAQVPIPEFSMRSPQETSVMESSICTIS